MVERKNAKKKKINCERVLPREYRIKSFEKYEKNRRVDVKWLIGEMNEKGRVKKLEWIRLLNKKWMSEKSKWSNKKRKNFINNKK